MNNSLRKQVLSSFKNLHRTSQKVFLDDVDALEKSRIWINGEYKNKKYVTDESSIKQMIELAKAVEKELKTTVIQAREVKPGRYELRITKDTVKLDNVPYKECGKS